MRWLFALLLSVLLAVPCARAGPALVLGEGASVVPAWSAVTAVAEPGPRWTLEEALRHRQDFQAPQVPRGNFGALRQALWLRVPLEVRGTDGRWVLQIDYAALNHVEVYLLADGHLVQQALLGNALPVDQRPLSSRAHALPLTLVPGQRCELLLRVQSHSAMLVPISFYRPNAFMAQESAVQLVQGVMAGMALALLLYSLALWLSLRDVLLLHYAVMMAGVGLFFIAHFGLGQQYLWHEATGLYEKISPLAVLAALAAGALFVRRALACHLHNPVLHRVLGGLAALATCLLLASVLGLLDYRQTQLSATLLGPLPMLLGAHAAWRRSRQGDRAARYMLLGWLANACGSVVMVGLVRGLLPAEFWVQHAFQWAAMLEMVLWLRVLGVRNEELRRHAERAQAERQLLLSLAHTDALTGLPNRRGLALALDAALGRSGPGSALAVYLLDLDGFKPVNDRLGHDVGDALLVAVGQRLRHELRAADVVARLGGDEFVILASGLAGEAEARHLGAKLLQAFELPFVLEGASCRVGLTIGFALAPQDGLSGADLLKRADAAMYAGKQAGRHCVRRATTVAAPAAG